MKKFLCVILAVLQLLLLFPAAADTGDADIDTGLTEEFTEEGEELAEGPEEAEEPEETETCEEPTWEDILDAGCFEAKEAVTLSGDHTLPANQTLIVKNGELIIDSESTLTVEGTLRIEGGSLIVADDAVLLNNGTIVVTDDGALRSDGQYEQSDNAVLHLNDTHGTAGIEGIAHAYIDRTVPYSTEDEINAALSDTDYRTTTVEIPYSEHILSLCSRKLEDGSYKAILSINTEAYEEILIRYRLLPVKTEEEIEWVEYDLNAAQGIEIIETCVMEIEAEQPEHEIFGISIAYTVVAETIGSFDNDPKAGSAPTITGQPENKTVYVGETAQFKVVATDATAYQWYYLKPDSITWTAVTTNGRADTYTLTTASRHNGYQYRCEVSNAAGSKTSSEATLTVLSAPMITGQPENKTVYVGETVQFKVVATGATAYQWYYLTPDSDTWAIVTTNGKADTYTLTAATRHNGNKYRCVATNPAGSNTSSTATLYVIPAPTITTQPTSKTVYAGQTVEFKVTATDAVTYQWYYLTPGSETWTAVTTNGKADTYTLTAAARHDGYKYHCVVSNGAGSKTSSSAKLTVIGVPSITTQPVSRKVYAGNTVQFKVVATNAEGYQWYYLAPSAEAWTAVTTNGKADTYTLTAAARHNGYKYRCEVSNGAGSKTSSAATLTVISAPTITEQPKDQTVYAGQKASFTITATDVEQYQWYYRSPSSDTWTASISSAGKSANYSFTPSSWQNGYKFRCVVTNQAGSSTSATVVLKIISEPTIKMQPSNQTVYAGKAVEFTIVADNAETYQWYYMAKDSDTWTAITSSSGKTDTYVFTSATRHNGYKYRCVVTNTAGSTTSSAAVLTVISKPTITTQPTKKTVYAGQTAEFRVVADNAVTYQWYYLAPDSDTWKAVSTNGKEDTYAFTTAARHNGYKYRCEVGNPAGKTTSSAVLLTVISKPEITTQPSNQTVVYGNSVTFKVVTSNATAYQWYYKSPSSSTWTATTSDNGKKASYTFTPATWQNGYKFRCAVSNPAGTTTSETVTLTVKSEPAITTQPTSQTVNEGKTATFKVVANNATKYQWYYLASGSSTWTAISSSSGKTATYSFTTAARHNGYKYRCVVSNDVGSVTSNTVTLTVKLKPTITTQPASQTVIAGKTATFKVVASNATGYQWYCQTSGSSTWNAVSGATSATYSFTTSASQNGNKYYCAVSNSAGSVNSNAAILTVNKLPEITTQPSSQNVAEGNTATFKVVANYATKYQWYYMASGSSSWKKVSSNGTSATYSLTAEARHNGYKYYCAVSNDAGSVSSNTVTLTVSTLPKITTQPSNQTVSAGSTATFKVVASNATSYQWYYQSGGSSSWYAVSGATSATYSFTASTSQNGYKYYCVVSNSAGSVASNYATLTVAYQKIEIVEQPKRKIATIGDTVSFNVVAKNASSYQWYRWNDDYSAGIACSNGTSSTYTFTVTSQNIDWSWYCVVSNASESVTTDNVYISEYNHVYGLTYSFSNSPYSFGYSSSFRIPLDRYRRFYSSEYAQQLYDNAGTWGGSCFGMSTTSGMMYSPDSDLDESWFGAYYIDDIQPTSYSSKLGFNATYMIECAQVMWWLDEVVLLYRNTDNQTGTNIQNIIDAVKEGAEDNNHVVICVYGNNSNGELSGHAIVGLGVQKVSSTETRILVYDCNYPYDTDRYIKVTTNSSGTPTTWSYKINDSITCTSIMIVKYDSYNSAWLMGDGLSPNSSLNVNVKDYTILNSEGKIVGQMVNGNFTSMQNDVYLKLPAPGMTTQNDMIRLPAGTYTIVNNGTEPMKVDMVHNFRRAQVSIGTGSVTVTVNDTEEANVVRINEDARGSYRILLTTEKDRYGKVEYKGVCDGSEVIVGVRNGSLRYKVSDPSTILVNDEALPISPKQRPDTNDPTDR